MDVSKWDKWWENTGEEWFKEMGFTSTKSIAAVAFGAGYAAGESSLSALVKSIRPTGTVRGQ